MIKNKIISQTCDSRECKNLHKSETIKKIVEPITTPHEINFTKNEIKCLYCKKITKLIKNKC